MTASSNRKVFSNLNDVAVIIMAKLMFPLRTNHWFVQ